MASKNKLKKPNEEESDDSYSSDSSGDDDDGAYSGNEVSLELNVIVFRKKSVPY